MSRGARSSRVKEPRERRCVATGAVKPEAELLRVALGPDGVLVPDVAAKLPGRGGWVSADRESVALAVRKRLFNRAFERPVEAPDDLADRFEALLESRALSLLGLARRAGSLAMGYDGAKLALSKGPAPAWRIEARDGARDGRAKLDRLAHAARPGLRVAGCFDAASIGAALGRTGIVHAVLGQGPEANAFTAVIGKLAGFRELDPGASASVSSAENG
ncbi:MAG: RNA-binding protein [Oceanicaulis sp.]